VTPCPVCGRHVFADFFSIAGLPVQDARLYPTREEAARAPLGDVVLAFCPACGHIGNRLFDVSSLVYEESYDITLHYSPSYRAHVADVVEQLAAHLKPDAMVVDIGSGKGEFLVALCEHVGCCGVGYDPTYPGTAPDSVLDGRVRFVRSFLEPGNAPDVPIDLITSRHVLEGVPNPPKFVADIARYLPETGHLYLEVPNAERVFGAGNPWTVIYESGSYYDAVGLMNLTRRAGLATMRTSPVLGREYIGIECTPGACAEDDVPPDQLAPMVASFATEATTAMHRWRDQLDVLSAARRRVLAWGAGGRAITFLSCLDVADEVLAVADINPRRQGAYLPRTGHRVIAPEEVADYSPDVIIVTNPFFGSEIRSEIADLGIVPEVIDLD